MVLNPVENEVRNHLLPLVGLKLTIARLAGSMRVFHFGEVSPHHSGKGAVGEWALHLQCTWRIQSADSIVTGSEDLSWPLEIGDGFNFDTFKFDKDGNLQDKYLGEWLGGYDEQTRSHINATDALVVEAVQAAPCGGAVITLSGGYKLVLFPDGRWCEWRFFRTNSEEDHFVVLGGKVSKDG